MKQPTDKTMARLSLEGKTLGKYRILEPLGRGGMAEVYKAYHPGLDRYVAIKVLRADLSEDVEFLNRFRREARAVAALRHPNIVQIYDFDVQDDFYYIVMELLEGDTLKAYLNALRTQGKRMPLGEVTRILLDILAGLSYAHAEGIIHRDLKPSNILLTQRGQAVLTDFGIAQIIGGTQYTLAGSLMGTLSYMAPEQGRDGKSDIRSDIYSVGVTLYEMLTGNVPFDADTPLAILLKHINDPLPRPTSIIPDLPLPFEQVVLKALAKPPEDRYQSAAEMANALLDAAQQSGVDVPAITTIPQTVHIPSVGSGTAAVFSGRNKSHLPSHDFSSGDTSVQQSSPKGLEDTKKRTSRGVFTWLTLMTLGNMFILWASGVFGWDVLKMTWPVELVLIGLLFFLILLESFNIWMFIPGGILLGNGLLLSYFSLTSRWADWTLLWPLEPLILATSIIAPFWLIKQHDRGQSFIRWFGGGMLLIAAIAFIITVAAAILQTI